MSELEIRALKRTVLGLWASYTKQIKNIRSAVVKVSSFAEKVSQRQLFNDWRLSNRLSRQLANKEEQLRVMTRNKLLQRPFEAFRSIRYRKQYQESNEKAAEKHHFEKTLRKVMIDWKAFREESCYKRSINQYALVFWCFNIQRRAFQIFDQAVRISKDNQVLRYLSYSHLLQLSSYRMLNRFKQHLVRRRHNFVMKYKAEGLNQAILQRFALKRFARRNENKEHWAVKNKECREVFHRNLLRKFFKVLKYSEGFNVYEKKTYAKFFNAWRWCVDISNEKKSKLQIALNFYETNLETQVYQAWTSYRDHRAKIFNRKAKGFKFLRTKVLTKSLNQWLSKFHKNCTLKPMAKNHYRTKLLLKIIRNWQKYADLRIRKDYALEKRQMFLKKMCLKIWTLHLSLHYEKNSQRYKAECHFQAVVKRKIFKSILLLNYKRNAYISRCKSADRHYFQKLKHKFLGILKGMTQSELIAKRISIKQKHHLYMKKEFFSHWLSSKIITEKLKHKGQIATENTLKHVKTRAFIQWQESLLEKTKRKTIKNLRLQNVTRTLNSVKLINVIERWKDYYRSRIVSNIRKSRADQTFALKLLHKYMIEIKLFTLIQKKKQLKMNKANQHYDLSQKRTVFNIILYNYDHLKQKQLKYIISLKFWYRKKIESSMCAFLEYKQKKKSQRINEEMALDLRNNEIALDLMNHWLQVGLYWENERQAKSKENKLIHEEKVWKLVRKCANRFLDLLRKNKTETLARDTDSNHECQLIEHQPQKVSFTPAWVDEIGIPKRRAPPRTLNNTNSIGFN